MKKILSTKILLTLLICMVCTTTFADDGGACGENLTWTYVEATKTLTISGSGAMIDASASGYPWHNYRANISKIVLENGVTSIGRSAFAGCTNLSSITIPNSVASVGSNALQGIVKIIWLTNTPPSGWQSAKGTINYVSNNQFGSSDNIIVYPFLSSMFEVDGVKYVPVSPSDRTCDAIDYVYDESKTEVNINSSMTYQGIDMKVINVQPYTFYQNPYLQKVNLDISGHLSQYALSNCQNLQIALLGNNVTSVDDYAFSGCRKLEGIIIPDAVNAIGEYAFSDCSDMSSVRIGKGTNTIGQYAFSGCKSLTSINIGDSTRFINQFAFQDCSSLSAIIVPKGVRSIGDNTFFGCTSLKEVVMKEKGEGRDTTLFSNLYVIFEGRSKLVIDVSKGDQLSFNFNIGSTLFGSLTISAPGYEVRYGKDGEKINKGTFKRVFEEAGQVSISLYNTSVAFSIEVTGIQLVESKKLRLGSNGNNPIFNDCPLDSVFIGCNLSYQKDNAFGYSPFYRNTSLRSIEITDKEERISDYEFYGCTNLQNVQIGDGVTSIGNRAFSGCSSLKDFSFGTQTKTIGQEAFSDCTALSKIASRAIVPPVCDTQALDDINKWTCKLIVPQGYVPVYQTADQWKDFFFIEEGEAPEIPPTPETQKCEKPTISYENGKLTFTSETEGAVCQYSITDTDIKTGSGNEVQLGVTYNISVYATKSGYENSETATATLCWIDASPKTEGITNGIANIPANAVLIQSEGGSIKVQGVDEGTQVNVYGINGTQAGSAISQSGAATINTNLQPGSVAIVKIGQKSVKVAIK